MKTNIVPALIIAGAILAAALLFRESGGTQVQALLNQLESSVQKKDSDGATQISRIAAGLSRSVSDGLKQGFQGGPSDDSKKEVEVLQKVLIKDVRLVPGRMKNQERVIGLIRNNSNETIRNVMLNYMFKDASGTLVDVSSRFGTVQGILKPGGELGFDSERELGDFKEKDEVLAQRRAAIAIVNVVGFTIQK